MVDPQAVGSLFRRTLVSASGVTGAEEHQYISVPNLADFL
jgi:hypothetical protein